MKNLLTKYAFLFLIWLPGFLNIQTAFAQPPELLSAQAKAEIEKSNFAPALAELAGRLEANPKNIDALMLKALIRRAQGAKYSELIETEYTQVLTINQNYWQAWSKAGDVCLEDKGWSCHKFFIKVKELQPDSPIGYLGYAKGILYGMPSSNYAELVKTRAIPDLMKVLELGKNDREVYRELGRAYDVTGAPDEAVAAYTTGLERDPKSSAIYALRGETKRGMKNYAGATADFTKAIELNPKSFQLYYARADVFEKMNNPLNAIADYETIIRLFGAKAATAHLNRGKLFLAQKKYALAINDLVQAIEKGDEQERECGYTFRGIAYLENNDAAQAKKDFFQVWETGGHFNRPCYGLAAYHVGNLRFKDRKYLWAETAYKNALKSYDTPEVRAALKQAEEYYQKYESSSSASAQSSSSTDSDLGEGDDAPNIRTASSARYREASAAYGKAVDEYNRAARSFTGAVEKYNAAGEAQFLYKGTLERAYRELSAGRSILEGLLETHGDYLPQNRLNQIRYKLRTMPLSPYSGGDDDDY